MVRWIAVAVALLLVPGLALGASTETTRLTWDGHSGWGMFSPDGESVVYVRHTVLFPPNPPRWSEYITRKDVVLWQDGETRVLLTIEPGKATARGEVYWKQRSCRCHWLENGKWLLVTERWTRDGAEGTLVRMTDYWTTRVEAMGKWYSFDSDPHIGPGTEKALNNLLHNRPARRSRLPKGLPERTEDFFFGNWNATAHGRMAVCEMQDTHFDGCCCTSGFQHRYIGVWRRGKRKVRRLTFSDNGAQVGPRLSPSGKYIVYKIRDWCAIDDPTDWAHLRLLTPDGRTRRRLAPEASHVCRYQWLDDTRILYSNQEGIEPVSEEDTTPWPAVQLAIVDVETGKRQGLTKGDFRHKLLDVSEDRFLVAENKLGPLWPSRHEADLYIIRPLQDIP